MRSEFFHNRASKSAAKPQRAGRAGQPAANVRKGRQVEADVVFLDLEDAVAPDDKVQARKKHHSSHWRHGLGRQAAVCADQRA